MPVTPRVSSFSLKTHVSTVEVPALGAAVDIISKPIFITPTNIVISGIRIVGEAAAVGHGTAPNTSTWTLQRRLGGAITPLASVIFNNVTLFPAAFTPFSIAVGVGISVPAGVMICIDVDNGGTAQTPRSLVSVEYWTDEDV